MAATITGCAGACGARLVADRMADTAMAGKAVRARATAREPLGYTAAVRRLSIEDPQAFGTAARDLRNRSPHRLGGAAQTPGLVTSVWRSAPQLTHAGITPRPGFCRPTHPISGAQLIKATASAGDGERCNTSAGTGDCRPIKATASAGDGERCNTSADTSDCRPIEATASAGDGERCNTSADTSDSPLSNAAKKGDGWLINASPGWRS